MNYTIYVKFVTQKMRWMLFGLVTTEYSKSNCYDIGLVYLYIESFGCYLSPICTAKCCSRRNDFPTDVIGAHIVWVYIIYIMINVFDINICTCASKVIHIFPQIFYYIHNFHYCFLISPVNEKCYGHQTHNACFKSNAVQSKVMNMHARRRQFLRKRGHSCSYPVPSRMRLI